MEKNSNEFQKYCDLPKFAIFSKREQHKIDINILTIIFVVTVSEFEIQPDKINFLSIQIFKGTIQVNIEETFWFGIGKQYSFKAALQFLI